MKLPLVALVLRAEARAALDLDSTLSWTSSDLIGHSPFTRAEGDGASSVAELCAATAGLSDNTAANLLIDAVGGLSAMNDFVRSCGDAVTRFDRYETAMNRRDGDLDTTTAEAFGRLAVALADVLEADAFRTLLSWLPGRDGRRIAAVAPAGIDLVHKTGTSGDGALNDVAILLSDGAPNGSLAVFTESAFVSEDLVQEIARRSFAALTA